MDETTSNWEQEHDKLYSYLRQLQIKNKTWDALKNKKTRVKNITATNIQPSRASDMEMFQQGNCSSKNLTHLFYSTEKTGQEQAKKVCKGCPVKGSCLNYALENPEENMGGTGVWGGTTAEERKPLRGEIAHGITHPLSLPVFKRKEPPSQLGTES